MSVLRAENITLQAGGRRILDAVSLALPATGSVALIGPNGAGKSSLLRIMVGVASPTSGEVLLDNVSFAKLSGRQRAKCFGYVPQQFEPFWDFSTQELIGLGLERAGAASPAAISQVMERFAIKGFAAQRWSTLSGGERARVLMAMVLATDPPILLADEPGASLDIRHRISLIELLSRRAQTGLSVVVMHDLDLAFRYFERIVVMADGRIVADGSAETLYRDQALDEAFGVRFERVVADGARLLLPRV